MCRSLLPTPRYIQLRRSREWKKEELAIRRVAVGRKSLVLSQPDASCASSPPLSTFTCKVCDAPPVDIPLLYTLRESHLTTWARARARLSAWTRGKPALPSSFSSGPFSTVLGQTIFLPCTHSLITRYRAGKGRMGDEWRWKRGRWGEKGGDCVWEPHKTKILSYRNESFQVQQFNFSKRLLNYLVLVIKSFFY